MNKRLALLVLLLAHAAQAAGPVTFKPGTLCDRQSGFCADAQGVSLGITELELGPRAARRLQDQINEVGIENFDPTTFTMSGGLHCDTRLRQCFTNRHDKKVHARATQALFGQ